MTFLVQAAIFLGTAVIVVPLFRRLQAGRGAGLPCRGRDHRPVGIRRRAARGSDAGLRGTGRCAAAFPGRSGTGALAAVGVAAAGVRTGRRAGARHRRGADRHRAVAGTRMAGSDGRGLRAGDVFDGHRAGVARRARRTEQPERAPRVRDPAVPGPGSDSAHRAAAAAGAGADRRGQSVGAGGERRGRDRARHRRQPRAGASAAEDRRALRRPRDLHRRRAAGRARRGVADGGDRPVDVARRVSRRRAAGRFGIPARARGRRRAVQGTAARTVLHGRRDERQSRVPRGASACRCSARRSA